MKIKTRCPDCGGELKEQAKWPGLYTCVNKDCKGMHITRRGVREFDKAIVEVVAERN